MLGLMLIAPSVLVFCAVIVYPLISAIYLSLFQIYTPTLEGTWVGLDNYAELLATGEAWRWCCTRTSGFAASPGH